jgi:hypothetical protein
LLLPLLPYIFQVSVCNDHVFLLVANAATSIFKASKSIKSFYMKLVYNTFLAHVLHRVTEKVRSTFLQMDSQVARTRRIFIKALSCRM